MERVRKFRDFELICVYARDRKLTFEVKIWTHSLACRTLLPEWCGIETSGDAGLWSDGRRTYVVLFNDSDREMRAYMAKLGIDL
jgi:hypothetical protein